ncbi:MAG: hypothetical protein OXT65_11550 [Alphaproteobacteria bacterium]|nr:hypothetical protein [Alphaproteobacteria bacterium]
MTKADEQQRRADAKAAALRQNLAKRKQQARARNTQDKQEKK